MTKNTLASEFARATGASFHAGRRLAQQRLIRPGFVVPDAVTAAQRQFEALTCHTLAPLTRDKQKGGALLGVTDVRPRPNGLHMKLQPDMQRHLIRELLPTLGVDGTVHGVPGLRCALTHKGLALRNAAGSAEILIASWVGPAPRATVQDHRSPISGAITEPESDKIRDWLGPASWKADAVSRDALFSRLFRRPRLLNAAGDAHGLADTHSHHNYDLVVDYCCGPTALALAQTLIRSGITGAAHHRPDVGGYEVRVTLGRAQLVLRRRPSCAMSDEFAADYLVSLASRTAEDYGPDIFVPLHRAAPHARG